MAIQWVSKAPGAVYRYTWTPPIADGDTLATYNIVAATGTAVVDSLSIDGNDVEVFISGGAAGETCSFTATGTSDEGEDFYETIYLPIRAATNALGYTVRDVCGAAMDKIAGGDDEMTAEEAARSLKRLNEMLAMWRIDGLDIGIAGKLVLTDTLAVPDEYISALIFNLRVALHAHHGQPEPYDVQMAADSKRLIANRLFAISDLTMPRTLSRVNGTVLL